MSGLETSAFRVVNEFPDALHGPVWVVMQLGSLNAPFAAAAVAFSRDQPRLAGRLLGSGLAAYLLAKQAKNMVGRGRPRALLSDVRIRGKEATGHGFVSGHAAVSMALAIEAQRHLGRRSWPLSVVVAPIVGLSRMYVGAHLPLDVVGGSALGWAVTRSVSGNAAE
jgi:membrane-associated phospholipid phosphatase